MITINDLVIHPTMFPDNTSQVWKVSIDEIKEKINDDNYPVITWQFEHEGEFMHLAQLKGLMDKLFGVWSKLYLPYLPYARQDKEISNETTFALKIFSELLNELRFSEVTCDDPHSEKASNWIRRFKAIYPVNNLLITVGKVDANLICFPDKGAVDKYSKIYSFPQIYAEKIRDQSSGIITGMKLHGDPKEKSILIVDDICDGGATFIKLASLLYEAGARDVNLFVSHGLFTKGIQILKDANIKRIFTKNGEVK